ncbi:Protein of unknown function [Pyronema omphalodes CBS 100304]|uniref:Uncharacterized protein n=1 Tax=Pyronema omphalodes (strain CBS 100304) TaxID=1076935 RepID=U4L1V3_PYROM|nr:Protein of unknown function [Pyronema omphalodes CBS 100304]
MMGQFINCRVRIISAYLNMYFIYTRLGSCSLMLLSTGHHADRHPNPRTLLAHGVTSTSSENHSIPSEEYLGTKPYLLTRTVCAEIAGSRVLTNRTWFHGSVIDST